MASNRRDDTERSWHAAQATRNYELAQLTPEQRAAAARAKARLDAMSPEERKAELARLEEEISKAEKRIYADATAAGVRDIGGAGPTTAAEANHWRCGASHREPGGCIPGVLTCQKNAGHGGAHLDVRFGEWDLPDNGPTAAIPPTLRDVARNVARAAYGMTKEEIDALEGAIGDVEQRMGAALGASLMDDVLWEGASLAEAKCKIASEERFSDALDKAMPEPSMDRRPGEQCKVCGEKVPRKPWKSVAKEPDFDGWARFVFPWPGGHDGGQEALEWVNLCHPCGKRVAEYLAYCAEHPHPRSGE